MIAFTRQSQIAKMTTARTAGTAQAVLPISSARNVMAKVKDTASFIEAARAIHGDKYDYSVTDYIGSSMPIRIICRKHGVFTLGWAASHYTKKGSGCQKCSGCEAKVRDTSSFISEAKKIHGDKYDYSKSQYIGSSKPITITCKIHGDFVLSQAQSHYKKNKACGCRKCGCRDYKTCECGFVGYGHKDFPAHANGMCESCWKRQKQAKKEANKAICKHCGGKFRKKNGVTFCSRECRTAYSFANKKEYRKFECKACGKHNEGWEWKASKPRQVCGLECQMKLALVDNRGRLPKDWGKASLKAKAIWKRKQSESRRRSSVAAKFFLKCKTWVSSCKIDRPKWQTRCESAVSCLMQRIYEPAIGEKKSKSKTIKQKANVFVSSCKAKTRCEWRRKCESVNKNLKKRWHRKMAMKERRILRENTASGVLQQLQLGFLD